ncbi:hypothetical protein MMC30_000499 [Trapelia coarctata]|nr:hypothetical protein [Trapelia coarctata]
MPVSTSTSEADIIFNRANVALAKSQRLIASWLPPRTEEELRNAKTEEEIEREEAELFAPVPELLALPILILLFQLSLTNLHSTSLGLGAPLPKDVKEGDARRQELSSNDRLRKQLLGKEFAKLYGKGGKGEKGGFGLVPVGSKPRPVDKPKLAEEQDDEGEGRSSLGRMKRRPQVKKAEPEDLGSDSGDVDRSSVMKKKEPSRSSKRIGSYLDEVLAEKQRKKQRKKQKNKADPQEGND